MSAPVTACSFATFEEFADAFAVAGIRHAPAEVHGVMCGLLASGYGQVDEEMLGVLAQYVELGDHWPGELAAMLVALRDATQTGFSGDDLDLALLLPDDSEELALRVAAAGQWCEGFLVGLGTGTAGLKDSDFSPALQEAISDLAAISRVALLDEDDEVEEDQADGMLEQVLEHCRMAALMVYAELVQKKQAQLQPDSESPAVEKKLH